MSDFAQFRTHFTPSNSLHRHDLPRAVCLVSSADRCSVSSVRACVSCLAWSALVFARPGFGMVCSAACDVQSVRARWGHLGGMGPEARVGAVSPVSSDQNKKGVFCVPLANTHPTFTKRNQSDCASLQIFRKKQKDPSRRLDCDIIS